jgi:pimeloyl-ACP methyl ester carboxylesterase
LRTTWILGIVLGLAVEANGQILRPLALKVRGVELHYVEQGSGEPLILLHGGQGDYRSWVPQIAALSPHFRVISYSRRYHYPNHNPLTATNHSAYTEAEDLTAVINTLGLGPVHLVGTSIGAATALVFALQHPEMVRSLVLAEPPIHAWIRDSAATADVFRAYMTTIQEPAVRAFRAGNDRAAMKAFIDGFAGSARFDELARMRGGRLAERAGDEGVGALARRVSRRAESPCARVTHADPDHHWREHDRHSPLGKRRIDSPTAAGGGGHDSQRRTRIATGEPGRVQRRHASFS